MPFPASFRRAFRSLRKLPFLPGFLAAASALALSSCVSARYPLDAGTLQARGLQPGEGYIVGSFHSATLDRKGQPGSRGANSSVYVRGTGAAKEEMAVLVPIVMPENRDPYLRGGGKPSEVIAIPLPAGDYEITGWSMTGMGSSGPVTVMNRKPIKVPLQVRAGEATYVGRFHSLAITGRNLLGFPIFAEGMIAATDEFAADQPRIRKAYPPLKKTTIRRSDVPARYKAEMQRLADTARWWDRL